MENATLRTGARTEKIPLIPHAQGTKEGAVGFICSIAEGTKMPRQAPIGSTKEKTIAARSQKDRPMRPGRCGKMKPYAASINAATTQLTARTLRKASTVLPD